VKINRELQTISYLLSNNGRRRGEGRRRGKGYHKKNYFYHFLQISAALD